ncbi:MAG: serine O-acetyltransferase [Methylocella sp.]
MDQELGSEVARNETLIAVRRPQTDLALAKCLAQPTVAEALPKDVDSASNKFEGGAMRKTWRETQTLLRQDRERLREFLTRELGRSPRTLFLNRSYAAVFWYRVSRYLHSRNLRFLARLIWGLNIWRSGAEISPNTEIEGGLVITNPHGVILNGKFGRNCVIYQGVGTGGRHSVSPVDVGGGLGLPCFGDDVVLETDSLVMGPVLIGDRVLIGPRTFVVTDVPNDAIVSQQPAQLRTKRDASETSVAVGPN